ncbi:MAG: ATP-NAD kinase family protein [Candidatus Geothermarchaeales archaeon]
MSTDRRRLGFVVNPIAGIGGRVGLKGSDGEETLEKAIRLGAEPVAPTRAVEALRALHPMREALALITYPRDMGENEAKEAGFDPHVIGMIPPGKTRAEDTRRAVAEMRDLGVELILFVGGDGTARDVLNAIDRDLPVLGVPSGVKIYSGVFAINPAAAGRITMKYLREGLPLREAEVMDIDEEAFRAGRLSASLHGYMLVPHEPEMVQSMKAASVLDEDEAANRIAIARHIAEKMEVDTAYIIGPGTTTKAITDHLGLEKTLLGVDVVKDGRVVAKDADEKTLLRHLGEGRAKIIVTPIGRQGFIFGRGNQQISPEVIRRVGREGIVVAATRRKLRTTRTLLVDTGDPELDESLRGYIRVISDYGEETVREVR